MKAKLIFIGKKTKKWLSDVSSKTAYNHKKCIFCLFLSLRRRASQLELKKDMLYKVLIYGETRSEIDLASKKKVLTEHI